MNRTLMTALLATALVTLVAPSVQAQALACPNILEVQSLLADSERLDPRVIEASFARYKKTDNVDRFVSETDSLRRELERLDREMKAIPATCLNAETTAALNAARTNVSSQLQMANAPYN